MTRNSILGYFPYTLFQTLPDRTCFGLSCFPTWSLDFPSVETYFSSLGKLVFHLWKVAFPHLENGKR